MLKISSRIFVFLLPFLISQLFSNRNLYCQENPSQSASWQEIQELLNNLDDIHENAKTTHLSSISQLIRNLPKGPSKDQIAKINSNRARLALAKICIDAKKYFWAEEIYVQIDIRKLSSSENRMLFDIITISLLSFPDRDKSNTLIEILKSLTQICRKELAEEPGQLKNLYQFYVQKQMFAEAMDLAKILWRNDSYHFNSGTLHSRAYRLRWESKNDYHLKLAREHFELLENQFPNSPHLLSSKINLFLLNAENKSPSEQIEIFNSKIKENIDKISLEDMRDILEVFNSTSKNQEIINLLIESYRTLILKNGAPFNRELILSFLSDKSELRLHDLVKIINANYQGEKSLPENLKNANIINKIQYLAYWNSAWEPHADFYSPTTTFRFDPLTKTSYLIAQSSNKNPVSLTYNLPSQGNLPDYIFFDLKNLEGHNIYTLFFNYDGKEKYIDKIVCSTNTTKLRIAISPEMKQSKKWQIIIKNDSKLKAPVIEVAAPEFLTIQNILELDKKIKD